MGEAVLAVVATLLGALVGVWGTREAQRGSERIALRQIREGRAAEARLLAAEAYSAAREAALRLHPVHMEDSTPAHGATMEPLYRAGLDQLQSAVRSLNQLSVLLAPSKAATEAGHVAALLMQMEEGWESGRTWGGLTGERATELFRESHGTVEDARMELLGFTEIIPSKELPHLRSSPRGALEALRVALGDVNAEPLSVG